MSIEIAHETEARLVDEAGRQGISVDALLERLIDEREPTAPCRQRRPRPGAANSTSRGNGRLPPARHLRRCSLNREYSTPTFWRTPSTRTPRATRPHAPCWRRRTILRSHSTSRRRYSASSIRSSPIRAGLLWSSLRQRRCAMRGLSAVEIVSDYRGDTYRGVYTTRFKGFIYVLHCFQKKSKAGIKNAKAEPGINSQAVRGRRIGFQSHHRERGVNQHAQKDTS